ncbi:MAG: hypothetical protein C0490_17485, partial [Marivirga sp.]|nr:hypothetical protein [Marivirga sp.]
MKTKIFSICLLIFLVIGSAFTTMHEDLHQAMTKMMQKMKSMKMTGDADHDFAMMMAEHHQGAIGMANIVLKSGKDAKIKSLAKSILDNQPQEQKQLRAHKGTSEDHPAHARKETSSTKNENSDAHASGFSSEIKQAMSEMETSMNSMKMTGNLDHDFAMMMIPHHESAIDMSNAVIKHGKDQEIKSIAEKI